MTGVRYDDTFDMLYDDDTFTSPPVRAGDAAQADADTSLNLDANDTSSRLPANTEPCRTRRGGAGLYLRLPRRRGLRGFVKTLRSGSARGRRSASPEPMLTFF